MKKRTIKGWFLKLRKDGIRRRFLRWVIPLILPHYHLAANGGRKKNLDPVIDPNSQAYGDV